MSHTCGRVSSHNKKIFKFFNKQSGAKYKDCCLMNGSTADCQCPKQCKTDGQHNIKRLKTRTERSQMRGGGKETSKAKLHHHHCHPQTNKTHQCCHSSCHCPSLFSNVPPLNEPSVITDSRLIGHHGLFNHEVKSIDIERLLSEQRKLEKRGQEEQKQKRAVLRLSSSTCFPSPLSSNDLCVCTNEVAPLEKRADLSTNTHDDCREKDRSSHGSDITPGQRSQQQFDPSSHSCKSIVSSKCSHLHVEIIKSNKTNSIMPENEKVCQLTPTADVDTVKTLTNVEANIISTLDPTPKIQEPPDCQTEAHGLSPNPLKLSSSLTADSLKMEPSSVSASVSALAARLCGGLHFPLLRKRNLLSESQEVLLKVLQERHGAGLQENLLKEWQRLSLSIDLTKAAQDHNQAENWIDENASEFHAGQPCFDNQATTSFKIRGSRHFNWKAGQQPSRSLEQTAEWLSSPVDASGRLLDDILRPQHSPCFRMDFESSEASASDNLFIFSPNTYWPETSAPRLWGDSFNKPSSKEWVSFDSYKGNFMYHSSGVREERCWPCHKDGNTPLFSYQTKMPHKHSVEHTHIPQKQELFQPDRCSVSLPFPTHIHHHNQPNHFMPFSQLNPPVCPPLMSHHTDLMLYPPSHMLERCPAPPFSCLPSPEHWSFPPMKLY